MRVFKRPFPVWIERERERERERENTQKARGNCIHLRLFELLRLYVCVQDPNTPQILKLPEIFREVLKQIRLLFSYGTSRTATIGTHFYSICLKEHPVNKVINISDEHVQNIKIYLEYFGQTVFNSLFNRKEVGRKKYRNYLNIQFAVNFIKGGKIGKACCHNLMQRHLIHGVYDTDVPYRNTHTHQGK